MLEFISSDSGKIETKAGNIVLKKKSPLFGNESIEGEITFPFTIPNTDELRRWLNFPDRVEAVNQSPIKRIQIKRNGHPILTGDLKLGDADSKQVETTLITGSAPFAALIKDVCLDELNLGFQTFADEAELLAYWNATVNGNVFTHPYYLPTILSEPTGRINNYVKADNTYLLEQYENRQYMTPMLYYAWLLPKLFESFGYELKDNVFIVDDDFREMLFFNIHNVNSQDDPLTIKYAELLPHYLLSNWLIDIQNAFGVKFIFNSAKQSVVLNWQVNALYNSNKSIQVHHSSLKIKSADTRPTSFGYELIDNQSIWGLADKMLPSVWEKKDIPDPELNSGKFCYVASEDTLYFLYKSIEGGTFKIFPFTMPGGSYNSWDELNRLYYLSSFKIGINNDNNNALISTSNIHPLHPNPQTSYNANTQLINLTYTKNDSKFTSPYVLFAKHSLRDYTDSVDANYFLNKVSLTWETNTWLLQNKLLPWWRFLRDSKTIEDTILLSDIELQNWDWTIPIKIENVPVLVETMEIHISDESEKMKVKITGRTL
jgi:hypothetical protein